MDPSPDGRTRASLLGRLRRSPTDEAAWAEFVGRYGPRIHAWCRHWHLQEADAQDVTQAVLARLAEKMRTFDYDPGRSFRGWLKTLTRHAWADLREAHQRHGVGSGDSQALEQLHALEAREDLVAQLDREFDQELLEEAMARVQLRVQPHTWEAFRLTAQEGLPGAEAAERLGVKVATVFVARSKVQAMLREELCRLEGTAGREGEA
ncbi:MAG: sigma-70 family RNA polymerase sigma factor [Gemmataceae bacterium]